MTRISLRLASTSPQNEPTVRWTVDCITHGVVILDAEVGDNPSPTPLHWRAGDWSKPPLDLRMKQDGLIESIQFVFQDEAIEKRDVQLPPASRHGIPTFDVSDWPEDRYRDNRVAVTASRLPTDELLGIIGTPAFQRSVAVTSGLRFVLDADDQLTGIAIGPLTQGAVTRGGRASLPNRERLPMQLLDRQS